jgi:hypothetical protein
MENRIKKELEKTPFLTKYAQLFGVAYLFSVPLKFKYYKLYDKIKLNDNPFVENNKSKFFYCVIIKPDLEYVNYKKYFDTEKKFETYVDMIDTNIITDGIKIGFIVDEMNDEFEFFDKEFKIYENQKNVNLNIYMADIYKKCRNLEQCLKKIIFNLLERIKLNSMDDEMIRKYHKNRLKQLKQIFYDKFPEMFIN